MSRPTEPTLAATLVLLRNPADPEVFWVRRGPEASFLSGYHAFPGGAVEPEDHPPPELVPEDRLAPAERQAPADPPAAEDPEAREARAAAAAALRETAEEVGFALGALDGRAPRDRLLPLGVTTTPVYLGRRFRVHYLAAWIDADLAAPGAQGPAVAAGDAELDAGAWITPRDALATFEAGAALLAPPTLALLRALAVEPVGPGSSGDAATEHAATEHARRVAAAFADRRHHPAPNVSPIRPKLALFPVRTPTLLPATHTNCYVVGTRRLVVIDPASPYPEEQAALERWLGAQAAAGATVEALILTHHHRDHVGGARALADRLGVPILAHPLTAERVAFAVDGHLDEGDRIDLGDAVLEVLHTPGHAPGHLCFVDEATRSAIVGDMVAGLGTILIEPGDGDMIAYLEQLERLRGLGLSCLCPSHGNVIGGVEARLSFYLAHRRAREAKVRAALEAAGTADVAALVAVAYADAPPVLRWGRDGGVAGLSLRAHLEKLVTEGHAFDLGDGRFAAP